jgi:transcriptional antiterminator NusG
MRRDIGNLECWYALFVKTKYERSVTNSLREKGYEAYLPLRRIERRWADRVKIGEVPLFPNYVFCRFNLSDKLTIVATPEVHFVIGHGRRPTAIPEQEISAVRQVVEHGGDVESCESVQTGEPVVVVAGPLKGLEGVVVKIKNQERLVVSIGILQRGVATEIDRRDLRPLATERRYGMELGEGYEVLDSRGS